MPAKQVLFYSTSADLYLGLERVERTVDIKYIAAGLFDEPDVYEAPTFSNIDGLGFSSSGLRDDLSTYLVLPKEVKPFAKAIPQRRGGTKYAVASRFSPSSVTFTPSAEFEESCILYGVITGVHTTNADSTRIFKAFTSEFVFGFQKIREFMVSPGAERAFDRGVRLTPSAQADKSMDLVK